MTCSLWSSQLLVVGRSSQCISCIRSRPKPALKGDLNVLGDGRIAG